MKNLISTILFFICSCAPTINNFNDYQKQFLPKSSFLPSKELLENKTPKIVVFGLDENNNMVANQSSLGQTIASNVENIISKNRLGEIIDRKAVAKLEKEIALAEMHKTSIYKGPALADYAISGTISNASFTSQYKSGYVFVDNRGNLVTIPSHYQYFSNVDGNLKIYELPSLAVVEAIEFSGRKERSENVKQDGGLSIGALQIGGKKEQAINRDDNLVRQAAENAIKNIEVNLKNIFAKKGYILEKRVNGKKAIFKVNLGTLDGIKQGDKFDVITQIETQNSITENSEIEKQIIAQGVVSDKIEPQICWIIIKNSEKLDKIRLGDIVKLKYDQKFSQKISNFIKSYF